MEEALCEAAKNGDVREVKEILRNFPTVNVNWRDNADGCAPLHAACRNFHDPVVAILLDRPDVDVNQRDNNGDTPFLRACYWGNTRCVRLLLRDPRVKINILDNLGYSPLRWASRWSYLETIKVWIASGREMDLGQPGNEWTDAIAVAEKWGKTEVVALLQRFKTDPVKTRHTTRVNLACHGELAAEVFAMVVFLSDGLLKITQDGQAQTVAARFFRIAGQLPLELQMVLCYHVIGSPRVVIHRKDSELAFKDLAKRI